MIKSNRGFILPILVVLVLIGFVAFLIVTKKVPLGIFPAKAASISYYVDCSGGNDNNDGLSQTTAWQNLSRANSAVLQPGDNLLLKRGCVWTGPLNVSWSGNSTQPITIDAYGTGALPKIQNAMADVNVTGSYLVVQNLATRSDPPKIDSGCKNTPVGNRTGFNFASGSSFVTLKNSQGSEMAMGAHVNPGSHHITITNNTFSNNNMMRILNRSNRNDDNGAWGMLLEGDDNEVSYNTISGSVACSYDYGTDGSAVEIYGGQRNNIHHNRASENLSFTELGNSRSSDNSYAYNIVTSSIDKANFLITRGSTDFFGPVLRTKAYNNVGYFTGPLERRVHMVACYNTCTKDNLTLKNNIIWSTSPDLYYDGTIDEGYNIYWKTGGSPILYSPISSTSKTVDPQFVNVGTDFHLKSTSPAINTGTSESTASGYLVDVDGVNIPQGAGVDIGAYEFVQTSTTSALLVK